MTYAMLCLFGVGVGILSGVLGIGGGVALVPGLVILFGFSQQQAQGTSLAVLVPPIGVFAAIVYYRHGYVELPKIGWIALGFLLGAYLGALLVPRIPEAVLRVAFGIVLLYVGFIFVLTPTSARTAAALPAGLAALAATVFAWFLRRKVLPAPRRREPPSEELEYHL